MRIYFNIRSIVYSSFHQNEAWARGLNPLLAKLVDNVKSAITIEQIARVLKLPLELGRSQIEKFE